MKTDIKNKIKEILPNAIISDNKIDINSYKDIVYSNKPSKVKLIVRVQSYEDVSKLLKFCNEYKITVVPWGGGTNLAGALTPDNDSIALDLKSLNEIIEFSKDDYYITVQSGITAEKIDLFLNKHKCTLGHDPWSKKSATIGGAIALDSIGNLYPKFGSIGDLVLSLKVASPNGDIIKVGRNLTKSSAFPNLTSIFIGSEGIFGIILEATLKIKYLPEYFDRMGFAFNSFEKLFNSIKLLEEKGLEPQSYIGGTIPKIVNKLQPKSEQILIKTLGIKAGLFLYYEGIKGEVDGKIKRAENILNKFGKKLPKKYAHEWWDNRYTYFEMNPKIADNDIYLHVFDLCIPRSKVLEVSNFVNEISDKLDLKDRVSHTLFCGVDAYTVALYVKNNNDGIILIKKFEKELLKIVQTVNGSITRNHGLGTIFDENSTTKEIGKDNLIILKELKKIFDPNRILNTGILHKKI